MQRNRILVAALAAGLLAAAASAQAAFVRLEPASQPAPGPALFAVFVDGLPDVVRAVTVQLDFVSLADVDLGQTSASTTGNPFGALAAAAINTTTCIDVAACWIGGGPVGLADPVSGPSIQLGTLTLASFGPEIEIFVNGTQATWQDESFVLHEMTNAGERVGVLPEPGALLLVALALTALAILGRANARD